VVGVVGKTPQLIEPLPHAIAQRCVEDEVLSKSDDTFLQAPDVRRGCGGCGGGGSGGERRRQADQRGA